MPRGATLTLLPASRGIVLRRGASAIASFRGTFDAIDLMLDAYARQVDGFGGKVHAGYAAAYRSVRPALRHALKGVTTLHVTGHSLGGALAVLAAVDALGDVPSVSAVTFAAPKVGDEAFARAVRDTLRLRLVVNTADVIPQSPAGLLGPYVHVGTLLLYYANLGTWPRNHRLSTYAAMVAKGDALAEVDAPSGSDVALAERAA